VAAARHDHAATEAISPAPRREIQRADLLESSSEAILLVACRAKAIGRSSFAMPEPVVANANLLDAAFGECDADIGRGRVEAVFRGAP